MNKNASGSTNIGEVLLGAAVVATALGFFIYAANVSGIGASASGYRVLADFENAEGISIGTDVRLAGIKVGTVTSMGLNKESFQASIAMDIENDVKISDDTSAKISSEGLLGGRFIALEPGGSETILAEGGIIQNTQGAVDIWSLISQAMFDKGKSSSTSQ